MKCETFGIDCTIAEVGRYQERGTACLPLQVVASLAFLRLFYPPLTPSLYPTPTGFPRTGLHPDETSVDLEAVSFEVENIGPSRIRRSRIALRSSEVARYRVVGRRRS